MPQGKHCAPVEWKTPAGAVSPLEWVVNSSNIPLPSTITSSPAFTYGLPEEGRGKGSSAVNSLLLIPMKSDGETLRWCEESFSAKPPWWGCPLCVKCDPFGFWGSIKQQIFAMKGLSLQGCNTVACVDRIRSQFLPFCFHFTSKCNYLWFYNKTHRVTMKAISWWFSMSPSAHRWPPTCWWDIHPREWSQNRWELFDWRVRPGPQVRGQGSDAAVR